MTSSDSALANNAAVADDDYCKLAYYLHCSLEACGVQVLQPEMTDYMHTNARSAEQNETLLHIATGKQFGLESLSFKTVFLNEDTTVSTPTRAGEDTSNNEPAVATLLPIEEAPSRGLVVDPLLLGGMIPVSPTHVFLCNLQWIRTYYAEPKKRLNKDTTSEEVTDDDIRKMFVRNSSAEDMQADMMDMAAKLQKMTMMMKGKRDPSTSTSQFQSFSGQGNTLGVSQNTNSSNNTDDQDKPPPTDQFHPNSLPDDPPAVQNDLPTTSIAVRLLNGQRKVVSLNLSMTVQDLAAHLKQDVKENSNSGPFRLVTGFPPKPLNDPLATIEDAGLKGAQVSIQKVL